MGQDLLDREYHIFLVSDLRSLGLYLGFIGAILGRYWDCIGSVLALYSGCIGVGWTEKNRNQS